MRKIAKNRKILGYEFLSKILKDLRKKLKIKAKYLMRNFDEESNLYENDFFWNSFWKTNIFFKSHDVFNKF